MAYHTSLLSEQTLKAFEKVPDLYLILSPDLLILTASDAYLQATHMVREEMAGKHLFVVFPDNPMAMAANAVQNLTRSLQQVLATGQPHRMAAQRYDVPNAAQPGGFTEKYWLPLNTPVLDEQGQVQYIIHKVEDVTERVLAENKWAREFSHLIDAQAIGQIGSFERLLTEDVITCSNEWYHLHGLEPQSEAITMDKMYYFVHPEDRQKTLQAVQHTIMTGESLHLIHRIIRANGAVRYVQRKAEVMKDEQRKPYKIFGTVQDITEQVETHQKVEEREALLRATEAVAHMGSYELDVATMAMRFSDGMYRLFGEAPQAFVPTMALIDERTHPDDVPVVKAILKQAIQDKAPYYYYRRICRTDGAWRTLEAQGRVECDEAGKAVKMIGLVQDVTERKKTEREILRLKDEIAQKAEEKYQALFNTIEEGIAICNVVRNDEGEVIDLRYQELNRAMEQQTGFDRRSIIGRKLSEVLPKAEAERWIPIYSDTAESGKPVTFEEYTDLFKQWYAVTVYPQGEELSIFYRDITERKQREQHQAFLIKLTDVLRLLTDPIDVQSEAARVLGYHLGASRAFYAVVEADGAYFTVLRDYTDGVPSFAGRYPLDVYGSAEMWANLRAGRIISVADAERDTGLGEAERAAYAAGRVCATVAAPLVKGGHLVAIFFLHFSVPHEWSADEMALVEETAERTWAAVERAKAEEALRQSEEKYRTLFNSMDEGYCIIQMIYDEIGKAIDFRYLQVNQAFERNTDLRHAEGKTIRELAPDIEPKWMEIYGQVARSGIPLRFEEASEALHQVFSLYAFRIGDPAEHKVAVIFSDITERRKEQEALRRSEQKLQELNASLEQQVIERTRELNESKLFAEQITEATPDFIMIFNLLTNKVEFVNQGPYSGNRDRYNETLHISYDQLVSRSHPEDKPKLHAFINSFRTVPDHAAYTLEYRVIDQGKTIWYRSRGKVLRRDEAGKPTHFISVVQDISDLKQLEQQNLQMRLEQQRTNLLAILDAQEEERRRISEGLHNGVGQILYAAKIHLNNYSKQGTKTQSEAALKQVDQILDQAIVETRALSHELAPAILEQFGLKVAMHEICTSLSSKSMKMKCRLRNVPHNIEKHLQVVIYRIAQELANNIVKHAQASEASLSLSRQEDTLVLLAEDDGKGFDPKRLPSKGIGLQTIKDRVKLLNGIIAINSYPGSGTLIEISLPLSVQT